LGDGLELGNRIATRSSPDGMEAFWSTLRNELIYRRHFTTRAQATSGIFDDIERFYNRRRRHSSLGYQSPLDYESNLN
jgi:transposase InsO family protein